MSDSNHAALLRRKARGADSDAVVDPITASRAVRMVLTKAAHDAIGLTLTVQSVAQETAALDDAVAGLEEGMLLARLDRNGEAVGCIALDQGLCAAVLEIQTFGALLDRTPEARPLTGTDLALCEPLLARFLSHFPEAVNTTPLEAWADNVTQGARFADGRAVGLKLPDRDYRILRMSIDFGVADRVGQLAMLLPLIERPAPSAMPAPQAADWGTAFQDAVADAHVTLEAVLPPVPMSLGASQRLAAGQVVPLVGCTVETVRLRAASGAVVATAKLGRAAGLRAVRLQHVPDWQLEEMTIGAPQVMTSPASILETAEDHLAGFAADSPMGEGEFGGFAAGDVMAEGESADFAAGDAMAEGDFPMMSSDFALNLEN